jgi:hypothetical protein
VPLILADMVYGPQDDPVWAGGPKTEAMNLAMLAATRASSYAQTDILYTLLVSGERSKRLELIAGAACAAAGDDRIEALFEALRKGK